MGGAARGPALREPDGAPADPAAAPPGGTPRLHMPRSAPFLHDPLWLGWMPAPCAAAVCAAPLPLTSPPLTKTQYSPLIDPFFLCFIQHLHVGACHIKPAAAIHAAPPHRSLPPTICYPPPPPPPPRATGQPSLFPCFALYCLHAHAHDGERTSHCKPSAARAELQVQSTKFSRRAQRSEAPKEYQNQKAVSEAHRTAAAAVPLVAWEAPRRLTTGSQRQRLLAD